MPAAAVIPAVASTVGAGLGFLSNKGANSTQRRANDQAFQLQQKQQAAADARYERDYAAWQKRQDQRNGILNAVLQKYGVSIPGAAPAAASGATAGGRTNVSRFADSLGAVMGVTPHAANHPDAYDSQGGGVVPPVQNFVGAAPAAAQVSANPTVARFQGTGALTPTPVPAPPPPVPPPPQRELTLADLLR